MQTFRVALLQLLPQADLQGNLEKGLDGCRKAHAAQADLALFPEMWSNGYRIAESIAALKSDALLADSDFVRRFQNLAAELNMAIGLTFLEQHDPLPRNALRLFDRHGRTALHYAKVHTCDFGDECRLSAGTQFPVCELDTAQGPVRIGAMICYDREFPESARILMLNGAEVLLVPNACPMEINRLCQLRSRAFENMTAIVTVNYPAGQPDCNGHSTVFDGIAYRNDTSQDMLIAEADEREQILIVDIPICELRDYRAREVHGNAYRHPSLYRKLIDESVCEPFQRPDARR